MAKCSFCRTTIERGTGTMVVRNDGSILFFCSSKCDKNMLKLGREPRHLRWTAAYVKEQKGSKKVTA